jgi:hypothetical protein
MADTGGAPPRAASFDLGVEGAVTEVLARSFWVSFGALAAELLDADDRVGEDLGVPGEATA